MPADQDCGARLDRALELMERYLADHPDASDTLDGIVDWWLARQCWEEARAVADEVVREALRRGLIVQVSAPRGAPRYARAIRHPGEGNDLD